LLTDGYMYDPVHDRWEDLGEVNGKGKGGVCVMGASASESGASHILIFGGDDGEALLRRVTLMEKIAVADTDSLKQDLGAQLKNEFTAHEGFSRQILVYHTITNTWLASDAFPEGIPVTTKVVHRNGEYRIISGETKPGVRSPAI